MTRRLVTRTVLLVIGAAALAGPAVARGGSCIISKAKETLLSTSGNGVVDKIHNDLNTLTGKLAALEKATTFYPECTGVDPPNTPCGIRRRQLISTFNDAVRGQQLGFEAFLDDVVSARDPDCENCRYVKDWSVLKTAGYSKVTPVQISKITRANLAAASTFEDARKGCPDDTCRDQLDFQIRQVLDPIPDQYGEPNGPGFPGGAEFATRMEATLNNIKTACPKP